MNAGLACARRRISTGPAGIAILAAVAALGPFAARAGAAVAPASVSTGAATQVSYGSATLEGSVNPRGSDTSYYFQYGPTRAYGGQTTIADAGAGTHTVDVSLPIAGLQPLTDYHYRLVAVNGAGAVSGADRTLLTTKVPLTLEILSSPDPVLFGGTAIIQGTLSGTENGDREVVLQATAFPFSAAFQDVGNPELTTATGGFQFPLLGLSVTTEFRVVTTTSPPVLSPVALENVAVKVVAHLGRARRAHSVRIYGTVTPAEEGAQIGILRTVHGRGVLVGGTTLRRGTASESSFSVQVRARRGVYRVLALVRNSAQVSNYSQPVFIR